MIRRPRRRDDERTELLARQILVESREELTRADGKATLLLAALTIVLGALASAVFSGQWTPPPADSPAAPLLILTALAAANALVSLGAAVYPRVRRRSGPPREGVGYFGDLVALTRSQMEAALRATSTLDRTLDQLQQIAPIVEVKYKALRVALWSTVISAVLALLAVAVGC